MMSCAQGLLHLTECTIILQGLVRRSKRKLVRFIWNPCDNICSKTS